jgi:hypothetical protein
VAGDKLHDQKLYVIVREVVCDARQRRVRQVRQQFRFSPEGAAMLIRAGESFLDGNDAAQVFVHRLINSAHAPRSELLDDAVATLQNCIGRNHISRSVELLAESGDA